MKIKLLVEGGNMKPGPAVAQQLGPMGINLGKVISDVNDATKGFKGVTVPVELDVDGKTKKYVIEVFSPPMSELIKKELKLETASGEPGKTYVGNIAIEQIIGIAKTKMPNLLANDLKAGVKLAVGSCVSAGILVESKPAKETMKDIEFGIYDNEITGEISEVSVEKRKKLDDDFADVAAVQAAKKKEAAAAAAAEEAAKLAAAGTVVGAVGTAPAVEGAAAAAPVATAGAKPEAGKKEEKKKK